MKCLRVSTEKQTQEYFRVMHEFSFPLTPWASTCLHLQDRKPFKAGEMVWGLVEGFAQAGLVSRWTDGKPRKYIRKVVWFGNGLVSEVRVQTVDVSCINSSSHLTLSYLFLRLQVHPDSLRPYSVFAQVFCPQSFATAVTYRDAIFHSLKVSPGIDVYAVLTPVADLHILLIWM